MTMARALGVIAVLSTAIAAPVFAREAGHHHLRTLRGPTHHYTPDQHFRGAYNQWNGHSDLRPQFQRNTEDFGGRDRSRIGGEDPDLHPSAY